jgi:hypothetical protein
MLSKQKRKSLLNLRGKIQFAPGYDYKTLRSRGLLAENFSKRVLLTLPPAPSSQR